VISAVGGFGAAVGVRFAAIASRRAMLVHLRTVCAPKWTRIGRGATFGHLCTPRPSDPTSLQARSSDPSPPQRR
jgi:hypothetical protein